MTDHKPKPCPFCGKVPERKIYFQKPFALCDTIDCPISGVWIAIPAWNNRPIEDKLLEACKAANNTIVDHAHLFNDSNDLYMAWSTLQMILVQAIIAAEGDKL